MNQQHLQKREKNEHNQYTCFKIIETKKREKVGLETVVSQNIWGAIVVGNILYLFLTKNMVFEKKKLSICR